MPDLDDFGDYDGYEPDDDRCPECHADVDHYLGCSEDPNPDYEAEAAYAAEQQRAEQRNTWRRAQAAWNAAKRNQRAARKVAATRVGMHRKSQCRECNGTGAVWTGPHVCTCGTGPGGYYGMHERGCGSEPCPNGCPYVGAT